MELSVPERVKILETLDDRKKYLNSVIKNQIEALKKELENRENSYYIKNFYRELENKNQELVDREERVKRAFQSKLNEIKNSLDRRVHKVITLNPLETLKRGYSVVTKNNEIIKSVKNIKIDDEIVIKVTDGIIKGRVKEINQ